MDDTRSRKFRNKARHLSDEARKLRDEYNAEIVGLYTPEAIRARTGNGGKPAAEANDPPAVGVFPLPYRASSSRVGKLRFKGAPLSEAKVIELERSWLFVYDYLRQHPCPKAGRSTKIIVNVETGEGFVPLNICENKHCPGCGIVWCWIHSTHYKRMMDGHVIYFRTVGPEENWDTLTTKLTREGFLWQAPKQPDGSRMLFSTCPDQGVSLDNYVIDELLDPRCTSLGMGGNWTSCRAWNFDKGSKKASTPEDVGDHPDPSTDSPDEDETVTGKRVVLDFKDLTHLVAASEEAGITVEFNLTAAGFRFSGLPEENSPEWWRWMVNAGVAYGSHRVMMARAGMKARAA